MRARLCGYIRVCELLSVAGLLVTCNTLKNIERVNFFYKKHTF